jgi:hypothetical protein
MSNMMESLREFARGNISQAELNEAYMTDRRDYEALDTVAYEDDPEFVKECNEACLPTFLMMDLMENAYDIDLDVMDEEVSDAFMKVHDYMVGQGLISEASININNPKVTFVKMSKKAQIERLKTIISLKMARKNKDPKYKKYKLGAKIKKANLLEIKSKYGSRAEKLAIKLWNQNKKNRKANAVVASKASAKKAAKK